MFDIHSFDDAVDKYWRIKRVISKNHTAADDIRPIEDRRYTFRRIKRYDDNTYALLDGDYDAAFTSPEYEFAMAPIVWTREADGDYIRIRNGTDFAAHTSRYKFLTNWLPTPLNMRFVIRNGKQFVVARNVNSEHVEYPLPKTRYTFDYQTKKPRGVDDHVYLKFKVLERGVYESVHRLTARKTTIDRELKKQWQPAINAFYAYMSAITPMLDMSWQTRHTYLDQLEDWRKQHAPNAVWGTRWGHAELDGIPADLAREVITDEAHELRVAFAALLAADMGVSHLRTKSHVTKQDITRMRSKYNSKMNQILNMFQTKEI